MLILVASGKKGKKKPVKTEDSGDMDMDGRYKVLFEASSDAIMLLDRDRFFDCNPATLRLFGLTKEIFIKLHPSEISPSRQANGRDSRTEADRRISEAFEKGYNKFEWIHCRSNGEDFLATVWLTAFPLEGRQVLQATVREVSPAIESVRDLEAHRLELQRVLDEKSAGFRKEADVRKRAEGDVRRLLKAVETSFNAIALLDMGMNIIYANKEFCNLAGMDSGKILGMNVRDLLPDESMKPIMDMIESDIAGREVERFEVKAINLKGQEMWVDIAGSVLFDDHGEPEGLLAIVNDITERRRMLDSLRESEEKFKSMVERSMDGVLIIQNGKVAYMNPALLKLSGYTREEQIGRDFTDTVVPEDRKKVMARYRDRIKGKKVPRIYETTLLAKDGTRIPLEVNAGVMEYQGRPADFVYLRDLTERRKAQDEIRAIKEQFEYVLGATKTGFDIIDENLNVLYVDPEWVKKLGNYSGKKCHDYFMGKKRPCEVCAIPRALKTGKTTVSEEYLEKEGRHIEVHTIPLKESVNGKRLVAEFNIDITQRRKNEEALRSAELLLRSIMDTIPVRVFWKDRDSRYLGCNLPFARDSGLGAPEELLGKDDFQMGWQEQAEMYRADDNSVMESGEPKIGYEEPQTTPDGRKIWLRTSKVPLRTPDGEVYGVLGTYEDITDRKKTDEEVRTLKEQFEYALAATHTNFSIIDEDLNVLYADPEWVGRLGDYSGKKCYDYFMQNKQICDNCSLLPTFEIGEVNVEERYLEEEERYIEVHNLPLESSGEKKIAAKLVRDITERKKAEEMLAEKEARYRELAEGISSGLAVYRAVDGGKDFEFVDFNRAAEGIEGVGREKVIGRRVTEVFPGVRKMGLLTVLKHVWKTGKPENHPTALYEDERLHSWRENYVYKLPSGEVAAIYNDVTGKKLAEEILIENEIKYRTLMEKANDAIFLADAKTGKLLDVNPKASDLTGLSREKLIGMHQTKLHPPEEVKRYGKIFRKHVKAGAAIEEDIYVVHKDGHRIPVSISASIFELGGRMVIQGIFHDLTERVRSEEELRSSREQLNALFQASTSGIGVEKNGKLFFVNPSFLRIFGYSDPDDLIGKPLTTIVAPKDRKRVAGYSKKRLSDAAPPIYEFTGMRRDSSTFDAEASVSVYHIGKETYYVGFVQDITERKRAEAAVHESEARFRRMAENIHDGLTIIENGKVSYINERACEIYGYPREELMGMTQLDLVIPEDREQLRAIIESAGKRGQRLGELEFWIQAKDGSRRYVRTRVSTAMEGESTSEFIITTDITARKQAEDENKRKMMKFLLEDGRVYLINEFRPEMSMEAFNDLLGLEYFGLIISRTPKKDLARTITGAFEHMWLGEKTGGKEMLDAILSAVDRLGGKGVVFIDRLDYLVFRYGFRETLDFIYRLRDQIYLKEVVAIVSIDPSTMKEDELNIMRKEMGEVEQRQVPRPSEDIFEIAQLIYERNSSGIKPSYSEIGQELKISKPTFRKRVRRLISAGYVVELTKGNRKVLELTQKGRGLFFK